MTDLKPYLKALQSLTCHCGSLKKPYAPLCTPCVTKLPPAMWYELNGAFMGYGYEENYDRAVEFLKEE